MQKQIQIQVNTNTNAKENTHTSRYKYKYNCRKRIRFQGLLCCVDSHQAEQMSPLLRRRGGGEAEDNLSQSIFGKPSDKMSAL